MKGSLCRLAETSFLWRDTAMRIRERFNPRAPCGARPLHRGAGRCKSDFNPRAPCGARRSGKVVYHPQVRISTHAPLAGCDTFLPDSLILIDISTHAPLAGRDNKRGKATQDDKISTHAPLAGRDRGFCNNYRYIQISTHAPLAGRDSKSVQITMHIFAITDKFQMLLHRMPPVRAFCSFLMQESHADFGCEPPK